MFNILCGEQERPNFCVIYEGYNMRFLSQQEFLLLVTSSPCTRRQNKRGSIFGSKILLPASSIWFLQHGVKKGDFHKTAAFKSYGLIPRWTLVYIATFN